MRRLLVTLSVGWLLAACGGTDAARPAEVSPAGGSTSDAASPSAPAVPPDPAPSPTPSPPPAAPSTSGDIEVTLGEWFVASDHPASQVSDVTFTVSNGGRSIHELLVVRTDLSADELPKDDALNVEESSEELTIVLEITSVAAGASADAPATVKLAPGTYALICNLPAHYRRGMTAPFEVLTGS